MALEDEIINIEDITLGTDINQSDKFIIETNNGTKLVEFKDIVINEDQITFKDKLIQNEAGAEAGDVFFTSLTGFDILSDTTSPGHKTAYQDISGTVELGKFNYNGIAHFASLSATYEQYDSRISNLDTRISDVETQVIEAGATLTPTNSAVNWKVSAASSVVDSTAAQTKRWIAFDTVELDPTTTHSGSFTFQINPFKLVFPTSNFNAGWYIISANLLASANTSGIWKTSGSGSKSDLKLIIKTSSGSITERPLVYEFTGIEARRATITAFEYIKPGDTVYIKDVKSAVIGPGSTFSGVRVVS